MLVSLLTYLLISNALSLRKDKSILFSRIVMASLILTSFLAFNNLFVLSLDKGIGLYGGLFHVTAFTQSFNVFIFVVATIVFLHLEYVSLVEDKPVSRYSWLTPQFFTDLLQTLLNRSYSSLEWCLNSPPKPHAFVKVNLQSGCSLNKTPKVNLQSGCLLNQTPKIYLQSGCFLNKTPKIYLQSGCLLNQTPKINKNTSQVKHFSSKASLFEAFNPNTNFVNKNLTVFKEKKNYEDVDTILEDSFITRNGVNILSEDSRNRSLDFLSSENASNTLDTTIDYSIASDFSLDFISSEKPLNTLCTSIDYSVLQDSITKGLDGFIKAYFKPLSFSDIFGNLNFEAFSFDIFNLPYSITHILLLGILGTYHTHIMDTYNFLYSSNTITTQNTSFYMAAMRRQPTTNLTPFQRSDPDIRRSLFRINQTASRLRRNRDSTIAAANNLVNFINSNHITFVGDNLIFNTNGLPRAHVDWIPVRYQTLVNALTRAYTRFYACRDELVRLENALRRTGVRVQPRDLAIYTGPVENACNRYRALHVRTQPE